MDCQTFEKLVSEFADNELSGARVEEIRVHLDECSKCSKLFKLEMLTKNIVRSTEVRKVPARLRDKVLSAVSNAEGSRSEAAEVIKPPSWFWKAISGHPVGFSVAAAALLLMGIFISVVVMNMGHGLMSPLISSVYANHIDPTMTPTAYKGSCRDIEAGLKESLDRDIPVASLMEADMQLAGASGEFEIQGRHCAIIRYEGNHSDISHFIICCMKIPIEKLPLIAEGSDLRYAKRENLNMVFWRCQKTRTTRVMASEYGIDELVAIVEGMRSEN